jgi:tetrapyrrole methylase family protein / MazG family protein
MPLLTIVGLGPASPDALTRRAQDVLLGASELIVSRDDHPVVQWLNARSRPTAALESLGRRAACKPDDSISRALLELARHRNGVVLATPGNPIGDDPIAARVVAEATAADVSIEVVPGLGYLDAVLASGLPPRLTDGLQVRRCFSLGQDGEASGTSAADPFRGVYQDIDLTRPTFLGPLYEDGQAAAARRWLARYFPAHQPVVTIAFLRSGATPRLLETMVDGLALDSSAFAACAVVRPVDRLQDLRSFDTLRYIVARLRAPNGCPWDREQTYASIKKHLVEETYEAIAALDEGDRQTFAGELGDVLLQVVMYAQFGREAGDFTLEDVLLAVNEKLIRRHPHVFGEVGVASSAEVLRNWERIKRAEKPGADSTFAGVPESAPALIRADAVQSRASRYGWLDEIDVQALATSLKSGASTNEAKLGELLFDLVTLARREKIDAEGALRLTTNRFRDAFDRVLAACRVEGVTFDALHPEERRRRIAEAFRQPASV